MSGMTELFFAPTESHYLIQMFLVGSFLVHALFSNLVLGGIPVLFITEIIGTWFRNERLIHLADRMADWGPIVLTLTTVLGMIAWAPLNSHYGQVSQYELEGTEWSILVVALCLTFGSVYAYKARKRWLVKSPILNVLAGVVGAVSAWGLALLFVTAHVIMLNPEYRISVQQEGILTGLTLPTVWPRFIHFGLAGLAGTGIIIAIYGTLWHRNTAAGSDLETSSSCDDDYVLTRYGIGWILIGTLPQVVVGPWLLMALPSSVRQHLVNGASLVSVIFFASLTFALLALVLLNASLMAPQFRGLVWTGIASLLVTISLMVVVREEVRKAWLGTHTDGYAFGDVTGWGVLGLMVISSLIIPAIAGYVQSLERKNLSLTPWENKDSKQAIDKSSRSN